MIDKSIQDAIARKREELKAAQQAKLQDRKNRIVESAKHKPDPKDTEARSKAKAESAKARLEAKQKREDQKSERSKLRAEKKAQKKAQKELNKKLRSEERNKLRAIKHAESIVDNVSELETKIAKMDLLLDRRTSTINRLVQESADKELFIEKIQNSKSKKYTVAEPKPSTSRSTKLSRDIDNIQKHIATLQTKLAEKSQLLAECSDKPARNSRRTPDKVEARLNKRANYINTLKTAMAKRDNYINTLRNRQERDIQKKVSLENELQKTLTSLKQ